MTQKYSPPQIKRKKLTPEQIKRKKDHWKRNWKSKGPLPKSGTGLKDLEKLPQPHRRGKDKKWEKLPQSHRRDPYRRGWEKLPQLKKSQKERREEFRKKARKSGSTVVFHDEWKHIDPGLQKGLFKKEGGRIGLKKGGPKPGTYDYFLLHKREKKKEGGRTGFSVGSSVGRHLKKGVGLLKEHLARKEAQKVQAGKDKIQKSEMGYKTGGRIGFKQGEKVSEKSTHSRIPGYKPQPHGTHSPGNIKALYKAWGRTEKKKPHSTKEGRHATASRKFGRILRKPAATGGRMGFKKGGSDKNWIQKATASIKRRKTKGKCTPITKPGCTGRAKALAKTFKKMAKKRKAA